ncbi:MAG: hypothetical protein ACRCXZ_04720 [Patescibacteria group bacterium]
MPVENKNENLSPLKPKKIDGSRVLTAIQIANSSSYLKPQMTKLSEDVTDNSISSNFPNYEISGNTQGRHEANHFITLTLVKDMLKDPKYAIKLAKLAKKYSLDLLNPSDFTFSGERIPLVLDRLFFQTVTAQRDKFNTRWLKFDFKSFPFNDKTIDPKDPRLLKLLADDVRVNIGLANTQGEKEVLFEQFYEQFVGGRIYEMMLSNKKLAVRVLGDLSTKVFDKKSGTTTSNLDEDDRSVLASLKNDMISNKIEFEKGVRAAFPIIERVLKSEKNQFVYRVFKSIYLNTVPMVEGFSYLEDKTNETNIERTSFFEFNLEKKIGISYEQYAQSIVDFGQLVWSFYQEDIDTMDWRTDKNSKLLILHDYSPRIETDYNIFESSEKGFKTAEVPAYIDIDTYVAKSGDYNETIRLRQEYKTIITEIKERSQVIASRQNQIKESNPEFKTDPEYLELDAESTRLFMITNSNNVEGKERLIEIIQSMKSEYGVSEI